MSAPYPFAKPVGFQQWLSLAESAAGAWQKALSGEAARESVAMMLAFNRQVLTAWTSAWAPTMASPAPVVAPVAAEAVAPAEMQAETPAEPVVEAVEAVAEAIDPEKPRRAPRAKAQPLATPQRRKAAPIKARPPAKAAMSRGRRATRH